MSLKVLVIVGTTRQGRAGRNVADWYLKLAKAERPDIDFELLDVADLDLPLFNEPVSPMFGQYNDLQKKLAEKVGAADAFVFVTGEYNHSVPASLKNFIDHLYAEWGHKAVAYVGYGEAGGARAVEHLVQIMAELRSVSIKHQMKINAIWEALDENGEPKDGYWFGRIGEQLDELVWWAEATKKARA